ncbi:hypothetical protein B0181_05685 [Moraxella caviae]|uniref:Uncharacterized protein n=1 Tax=Moraxella caviae TaxID=34060 RepID=A0A1T0A2F5_9GAMM|nr:hypothetical protein [Moraxella caviae]OOR89904.1 hypothetical protein B0181_05685 [Moraxella caviae]STZ14286.1 Uncharacterised protein [Moraxella caviae]VEW10752.1 Uncharacterised protein [Moraxella caviae]
MDWLKNLFKNLPLDDISDRLAGFFMWWAELVKDVPDTQLPLIVYATGVALVLVLWLFVMWILPRPFKGMSWAMVAAFLLAPGSAAGDSGEIAPAIVGVFHALMLKDFAQAVSAFLPILAVFAALLFLGAIWQMLRSVMEASFAKTAETARIQELKRLNEEQQSQPNP